MHTMPRHYMYKCRHDQMQPFERCQKNLKNALENIQKLKKEKASKSSKPSIFMCKLLLVSGVPLKITVFYLKRKFGKSIIFQTSMTLGLRSDPGLRSRGVAVAPPTRQISNCDATWGTRHFTWQPGQVPRVGLWKKSLDFEDENISKNPQVVE